MTNVMVDIKTLGRKPGCKILSIGAVEFDPYRRGAGRGAGRAFYTNVDCAGFGLIREGSTAQRWAEQLEEARSYLEHNRKRLDIALREFRGWFNHVGGEQVWSQGAAFDIPILEFAFERVGLRAPWKFRDVRDTRTVYDILGFDVRSIEREGTLHSALDDALHQVKCVQTAIADVVDFQRGFKNDAL